MKTKSIEQILTPPPTRWVGNGFNVHNFFPGLLDIERMSPFVLLDYNARMYFPPSDIAQGVGVHPHRGIETVTVAFRGKVAHHDSAGHGGVISEGDLQWMTAGGGILHKEYHESEFNRSGGDFHMAQIWVNLPEKYKMTPPRYQALINDQIPVYDLPSNAGTIEVVAGECNGVKGIALTFSPIEMYIIKLKEGRECNLTLPTTYNTGIIVVEGVVKVNKSKTVQTDRFILFGNDGENIVLQAETDSILLLLSGEPLNEPIAAGGPFVMNTKEELRQAYMDYQQGKFGYLED